MDKRAYLLLFVILLYISENILFVEAVCPPGCLCLIVLNLCSITSTLNYLVNTVIDTGLDLSSSGILKIAGALVQVNGNLLCNGQIQLLSGVLVVDGNLSVLTGCKISVSGVSSINVTGPVLLPQIEFNYLLDSSSNPLSTLTWVGSNISMEVSALTVASNVVSKMEFVTPNALVSLKKSASAAAGAIAKLGSAVFKLASSLSVIGLSFGVVLIDSCVPPIVNVPLIDSLSIFNTSITTGLQGTFTQLNLTQSNVLFNQNAVVTTLLSTNSIVNIVNGASTVIGQVTISQSSLMSGLTGTVSAVSLLTASTLNLGTQATIATLSLAGSSILNTGTNASITSLTSLASTVNIPLTSTVIAITATLKDSTLNGGLSRTCNLLNMTNSNALLNRDLSLGNLVGSSSKLDITNLGVTIQSLVLANSTLNGGSSSILGATLSQNSLLNLNLPTVITGLVATVSDIVVTGPLSNLTLLGNSSATDSGVGLLGGSLLQLNGALSLFTTSPQGTVTLIEGGGRLVLGQGATLALKASIDMQLRLDAQIKSLGGLVTSVASLQIVKQLLPIDSLTVVAKSLLVDSGILKLSNSNLSILDKLGFGLVKGVLELVSSTIDIAGAVLVPLTDLVIDDVVFNLQDQVIPDRLTLDVGSTVTVGSGGLSLSTETRVNIETAGQNNTLYTIVYSPDQAILCDDTVVGNSSDYTFLCDNRLIAVKFSNCSRFQCPSEPNRCVDSANNCPVNNACPLPNYNYTCWNGECHQNITTCPSMPPCGANKTRCGDSSCVIDSSTCPTCTNATCQPFKYNGCPIGKYQCLSGSCVSNLTECCQNCGILPTYLKTVEIKSPINSTKDFIVPIISQMDNKLAIYGYIMFPANFYDSEIQEYVHLKQSDDSYLDTISGGSLFNITSNTTFRESVKSLIFDITLGNYSLFKKSIQFELKSSFQNQNQSYLSFINETQNEWKIVGSQDNDDDMNNGTATIPLPASNVVRCGKHSNHTCGNTSHFTNFGVLLYIGSDKGSSGGNNNGGSNANGEEISEEGKWIKKVLVPVCIAVGGAALVSVIVGFFVAKIIRHGRLKYWWASRGASSEHINQDAELSEISNK